MKLNIFKFWNEIKNKEKIEDKRLIKYINTPVPVPKPQPIGLINTKLINIECFQYRVMTKDDFIRYRVNRLEACIINKNTFKKIEESWNRIRKGYNFVIAVGNTDLMFYSVDVFNEHVGGHKDE